MRFEVPSVPLSIDLGRALLGAPAPARASEIRLDGIALAFTLSLSVGLAVLLSLIAALLIVLGAGGSTVAISCKTDKMLGPLKGILPVAAS